MQPCSCVERDHHQQWGSWECGAVSSHTLAHTPASAHTCPRTHTHRASWRHPPPLLTWRKHWGDMLHRKPEAIVRGQLASRSLSRPCACLLLPPTRSFSPNLTGEAGGELGGRVCMKPTGVGLSQSFTLSWGPGRTVGCAAKGASWNSRRFWEDSADTRHREKKNLQASQSSPTMSWQPLKAAEESGGLSIRPGYSHSQAGPTAGIRCQVPTGSAPPTAAALFTLTASWRSGRSPPTTDGQTEAQSHLSASHRRGQNESSVPQPNS